MKLTNKQLRCLIKEELDGRTKRNAVVLLRKLDELGQYIDMQTLIQDREPIMERFLEAYDDLSNELKRRIQK